MMESARSNFAQLNLHDGLHRIESAQDRIWTILSIRRNPHDGTRTIGCTGGNSRIHTMEFAQWNPYDDSMLVGSRKAKAFKVYLNYEES